MRHSVWIWIVDYEFTSADDVPIVGPIANLEVAVLMTGEVALKEGGSSVSENNNNSNERKVIWDAAVIADHTHNQRPTHRCAGGVLGRKVGCFIDKLLCGFQSDIFSVSEHLETQRGSFVIDYYAEYDRYKVRSAVDYVDVPTEVKWNDDQDNPPLSARAAVGFANVEIVELRERLGAKNRDIAFHQISLVPVKDKWIWVAEFRVSININPEVQTISIPILFTKRVISPEIELGKDQDVGAKNTKTPNSDTSLSQLILGARTVKKLERAPIRE